MDPSPAAVTTTLSTPPAPPPGFVPEAAQPSAPAPPPGFEPEPPPPPGFVPEATPQTHWYNAATGELKELNTGFTTALSQTGLTAQKVLGALPVVGPAFTRATADARAADVARAALPMDTPGRMAGNAIENIMEFAAGDEALKGASFLTKVDALQPLVQALKKSPTAVQVITNMMGQGARNAALAAGQSAVHGNAPSTIRTAALVGGGHRRGSGASYRRSRERNQRHQANDNDHVGIGFTRAGITISRGRATR